MSTEPATSETDEPEGRGDGTPSDGADAPGGTPGDREATLAATPEGGATVEGEPTEAAGEADGADGGDDGDEPAESGTESSAEAGGAEAAPETSEAQAELAAQRLERERIERRKAEKSAPITSGAGLSGTAADLLAAVRAVEGGRKPTATAFDEPRPAPRRSAPEPVRRPEPVANTAGAAAPSGETVEGVRAVLAEGGAPEALVPQVAEALGEGAGARLREDPWQLLRIPGVRPEQADGFARALLGAECGPDDERRGRAVTVWLLEQAAVAGHTALQAPALAAALAQRSVPDPDEAVQSTVAEGEALVFQDALDDAPAATRSASPPPAAADDTGREDDEAEEERPVRVLIGLERYALAEESLADGLARVMNSLPKEDTTDWTSAAASAPRSAAELIRAVAGHGLVLHTGGEAARAEPAALVTAARTLGLRAYAATHSADGRRRFPSRSHTDGEGALAEGGDTAVTTLAGLLSGTEGPGRDVDGMLALDLLVVLDAPQVDVETAALLAESLPDGARLVLSGDPGVLWSAGPGRVFADLLAARACPQVASRTPDPGPVGELVSGIGIGELNQVDAPGKEVVIVPVRDAGEAVHRTAQLVVDSVPRAFGIPAEEVQVITPGHGGAAGTRALNTALKERLNPGPGRFGGFDPGDRVAYSPAPGRSTPGRVVKADAEGLHLECAGTAVVVPKERVEQTVRHGWALTAHQAVGHRWPAAVVVLPGDAAQALSRPWVYTAFGRAERHLSVVHGVEQALPRAVAEVPAKPRTTRLPALLKAQVPSAD
ncbi:helix-hairpin-helix domain-containing protein [Streptomyces europaeiscabiei]|uniref:Helix-hairpin-helix domain-containing protein n=3 Tax=Streptomyces europaeiscabiei TaxID=146819 RepID=A0ABU4NSD4_9ACTN|nr:helix-hairpin-helix domain-containing protein [Streptomyces europaeiscabiei]MDX3547895.1 helix-hairpin-helix domain-containing protein [Streptomyces europaeiscabiei]MDX3557764.1 helix-hairpin-helix domain-containing protein [Streptomyces europaeiscabiei]MDX3705531.1 helix-hairpin-helix domain-containing protein [Streptomyces europaeiscabiei]